MGRRIQVPQRKNFEAELLKDGGTIVGGVVGGIAGGASGGPAGAVGGATGGAMLGRNIGGFAGGLLAPDRAQPAPVGGGQVASPARQQQPGLLDTAAGAAGAYQGVSNFDAKAPAGDGNTSAIQRRMDAQRTSNDLAAADAALQQASPEDQQRYGPAIKNARYLDMRQRGMQ